MNFKRLNEEVACLHLWSYYGFYGQIHNDGNITITKPGQQIFEFESGETSTVIEFLEFLEFQSGMIEKTITMLKEGAERTLQPDARELFETYLRMILND